MPDCCPPALECGDECLLDALVDGRVHTNDPSLLAIVQGLKDAKSFLAIDPEDTTNEVAPDEQTT